MKSRIFTILAFLAFSISFAQADDETIKHDAEVARQRAVIDDALAKQNADNAAALKAAQDKAAQDARDKAIDSIPSGSDAKGISK